MIAQNKPKQALRLIEQIFDPDIYLYDWKNSDHHIHAYLLINQILSQHQTLSSKYIPNPMAISFESQQQIIHAIYHANELCAEYKEYETLLCYVKILNQPLLPRYIQSRVYSEFKEYHDDYIQYVKVRIDEILKSSDPLITCSHQISHLFLCSPYHPKGINHLIKLKIKTKTAIIEKPNGNIVEKTIALHERGCLRMKLNQKQEALRDIQAAADLPTPLDLIENPLSEEQVKQLIDLPCPFDTAPTD